MSEIKKSSDVTLKEISRVTNLAVSTVSGILNENPRCYAGESARKRVKQAAAELGYRPNFLSRGLRLGKTNTLGLIMPSIHTDVTLSKIELIEKLAWDSGYNVFIGYSNNNTKKEEFLLSDFISRRVDGIILIAGENGGKRKELEVLIERKFPVVVVGRLSGYDDVECPVVSTDYFLGGKMAAAHFIDTGLRNLYAVCPATYKNKARIDGFVAEAAKKAITVSVLDVSPAEKRDDFDETDHYDYLDSGEEKRILNSVKMPAGIFAYNDETGACLLRGARELGIAVPEELSVIGFDDSQIARFSAKPLSTVRQMGGRISRIAFDSVIRGIDEGETARSIDWIKPELILRESTRCNAAVSCSDTK